MRLSGALSGNRYYHGVEPVKGVAQERVGKLVYAALVSTDVSSGKAYHVRVSSYSSVGAGEAKLAGNLSPLQSAVVAPREVLSVVAAHTGDHEVLVGWDQPLSTGGSAVDAVGAATASSPALASGAEVSRKNCRTGRWRRRSA